MSRSWAELFGDAEAPAHEQRERGFFGRLRNSLAKSRRALTGELASAAFDPAATES